MKGKTCSQPLLSTINKLLLLRPMNEVTELRTVHRDAEWTILSLMTCGFLQSQAITVFLMITVAIV